MAWDIYRDCPRQRRCYACNQPGHVAKNCYYRGNEQGTPEKGQQEFHFSNDPHIVTVVAHSKTAKKIGKIGGVIVDLLVDSGSSLSLIKQEVLHTGNFKTVETPHVCLVTAVGSIRYKYRVV